MRLDALPPERTHGSIPWMWIGIAAAVIAIAIGVWFAIRRQP